MQEAYLDNKIEASLHIEDTFIYVSALVEQFIARAMAFRLLLLVVGSFRALKLLQR